MLNEIFQIDYQRIMNDHYPELNNVRWDKILGELKGMNSI